MKAKVSLKTVIVSALLLVCGLNASADNKSNLIYNSEEVNGMKVADRIQDGRKYTCQLYEVQL